MGRLACVNVPYISLQNALKRHPDWQKEPVAIVDEEKPTGTILEVNKNARQKRILPGMSYAAGLSLDGRLRASERDPGEVAEGVQVIASILTNYSPGIEPGPDELGIFWAEVHGLDRLFGSFESWAEKLQEELRSYTYYAAIVVGYSRFHTYAIARAMRTGVMVLESRADEKRIAGEVPIERLEIDVRVRDGLSKLGIRTLEDFLELPVSGVRERFGEEAHRLRKMAAGELALPLQPSRIDEPVERRVDLDEAECDSNRLLFIVKRELHPMMLELASRHQDLAVLRLTLELAGTDSHEHVIKPATPTLDEVRLLELVRLRLDNLVFPAGVSALVIVTEGMAFRRDQTHLFDSERRRDLESANHALARLRAEFGDRCVLYIRPADAHAPEARFELEPLQAIRRAEPSEVSQPTLIRRIRSRPEPLHRFRNDPIEGWRVRGLDPGPIVESHGPFAISGHWWSANRFDRDYYVARTRRGDLFWLYYDHHREQWFLHGEVE